jgi:alpha-mannosidase
MDDIRTFLRLTLRPAIYPRRSPLEVGARHLHGEPIPAGEAQRGPFEPFEVGQPWGARWDTTWFRLTGRIPTEWAGEEVAALVHLGGDEMVGFTAEGLIFDAGGRPVQGLHHRHRSYGVATKAEGGESVEVYVEAAANPKPPWPRADWPLLRPDYVGEPMYVLGQAELATVDREIEGLWLDMRSLVQLGAVDPDRGAEIGDALHQARALFDGGDVIAARAALAPSLARRSSSVHRVTAVGHAHIDSAWLWPLRETRRKCARTFSNQLRLLERFPEHHFACTQAVQYQWIKDDHPDLYRQIRARVAEGRWEPVGGMWVESDGNVPSGESLVRQLVHGKRFFQQEFGVETHELWIPDVFGYPAAWPQIARQAGVDAFVTQKMSWNDTNVFPHSTFWWEGHDGSRVLAHFPPANTYNGDFSAGELAASERNFRDAGRSDRSLYPYGYGDGGGGPTAEMLEMSRRLGDAGGLPVVRVGSVAGFLDEARADGDRLAVWVGELYLEAHRATLTTHADVKWGNRRGEEALRAAEMWSVAAGLDRRRQLDRAWKLLLLHQFHDILPGSSINWVYDDTRRDHAEVLQAAGRVTTEAQAALVGAGEGLVVFNPSSYDRTEVVDVPERGLAVVAAPACGWAPVTSGPAPAPVEVSDNWMENDRLSVTWDGDGLLTSVWDHQVGREVLAAGERGNLFQLHEDNPRHFDAWDVERSYLDHVQDLVAVESIEVIERDRLRAGVRFVRRSGQSEISQVMRLRAGSARLEFETEVDWHERHRFLKVAFPVAVRSTRATYEIQHGHIDRPTVENTSWDLARFEVCGHRWADLSEAGYGVALLNNGKYGYDVRGHVMRLSLLRAPGYPDPEADQGHHQFVYALLPHAGEGVREVVTEAEWLNLPLSFVAGSGGPARVVAVDRPGVSVEAVKWADDGDGAVVVRLCEVLGGRGPARVSLSGPGRGGPAWTRVTRTDVLERDLEEIPLDAGSVRVDLRPFELVTLKFVG